MSEKFNFQERVMPETSDVDKAHQERAKWLIKETGIEEYLKKDGQYLDIGSGTGHIAQRILEDMEEGNAPLKKYYGIDIAEKPYEEVEERERIRQETDNKNPLNFIQATAEVLPFKNRSLDGVSYIFSIHHMNKEEMDKVFEEAKRVIKKDGYIFIVEDLVETEEQKRITEEIDRELNQEDEDVEHNYKSDKEWERYFNDKKLELIDKKFFQSESNKGPIQHGFYVVKIKGK